MKKLLVMLLAVSMVLSMAFALASCGGDNAGDDSSKPAEQSKVESTEGSTAASEDSAAASEDSAASSEDSAVASDDSVDASEDSAVSSEDSADTSKEESAPADDSSVADDSSAIEVPDNITYKTTPTKTNYALNKTYTLTRDTTEIDPNYLFLGYSDGNYSWSDWDTTANKLGNKMTDGVVGSMTNDAHLEEYGGSMSGLTGVSVMLVGTNKLFEYVIDLGDYYGDIKSLKFRNVRHGTPNGNNRGFKLRLAYVSDDNVNWTKVSGDLTSEAVAGAPEIKGKEEGVVNVEHFDFTYTLKEAAKGRFVRVIIVSDGGYVIQLEEIEIWN